MSFERDVLSGIHRSAAEDEAMPSTLALDILHACRPEALEYGVQISFGPDEESFSAAIGVLSIESALSELRTARIHHVTVDSPSSHDVPQEFGRSYINSRIIETLGEMRPVEALHTLQAINVAAAKDGHLVIATMPIFESSLFIVDSTSIDKGVRAVLSERRTYTSTLSYDAEQAGLAQVMQRLTRTHGRTPLPDKRLSYSPSREGSDNEDGLARLVEHLSDRVSDVHNTRFVRKLIDYVAAGHPLRLPDVEYALAIGSNPGIICGTVQGSRPRDRYRFERNSLVRVDDAARPSHSAGVHADARL